MAILDSQGRLFGKVSILDFGAALVILLVVVGIFFFPGTSGTSVAQNGPTTPIEVDAIVRGLSVREPDVLIDQFNREKKTNIIIRNQPYGEVAIKEVKRLPSMVMIPQPDGTAKVIPDPRPNDFGLDMIMTLSGKAEMTKTGPVLGNSKIKIGTTLELEGLNYNFRASVIDLRMQK